MARDRDGNILNSDEEILDAARHGHLPGRFANAREAEAFDYSLEEDSGLS